MNRTLKKAVSFFTAVALSISTAISVSAAGSSKKIVEEGNYKHVILTESGVFFTDFSEKEMAQPNSAKSILCVTPDGATKKVKLTTKKAVDYSNINTASVYSDYSSWGRRFLDLSYFNDSNDYSYNSEHDIVFSSGKTVHVSEKDEINYINNRDYVAVISSIKTTSKTEKSYKSSVINLYNGRGKAVVSVPYSTFKGANGSRVTMADYDGVTKTALFSNIDDRDAKNYYIWAVRDNKLAFKLKAENVGYPEIVKNKKGKAAISIYDYDTNKTKYYYPKTGKKMSSFEPYYSYDSKSYDSYSVKTSGSNYNVYNKSGKKLYSISKKNVAGYHVYKDTVVIITKSGSKYGLILVK
ncbi:MAG: hypothetical protein ACI4YB_02560 [Oscillospiraceae bacterium]